jgi:hypothetical protein
MVSLSVTDHQYVTLDLIVRYEGIGPSFPS